MTGELPEEPGRVPVTELRELADEWKHSLYTNPDEQRIRRNCADDLEAVIEDYSNE